MNIRIVIPAKLLFLLRCERSHGLLQVTILILAANHEADLARSIGGDGRVGVLDGGEHLFAVGFQLGDQWQVEPLVLS